jgi:hypothetical protein
MTLTRGFITTIRAYGEVMGRIVLIAAAAVLAFFVLGSVLGFVFGFVFSLLKWVLLLGLIALAVAGVLKLLSTGDRRRARF